MSELYTNYTDNQVSIRLPATVPYVDLSLTVNGEPFNFGADTTTRINQSQVKPGHFQYNLPYRATPYEGELVATWSFVDGGVTSSVSESYTMVTPLVPIYEIMERHSITAPEAERHESLARQLVTTYTGQTFGKFAGDIEVTGAGGAKLFLPRRLISVNYVTPRVADSYLLSGSNFFINANRTFKDNNRYVISGVWGYNSVPTPVKTAAEILIDTLVADEPSYRDRYLTAIRSADWRLDFNSRAFDGTGNVTVDHLLDPFVVYKIAVI